ncbi:unnamed protein product [Thelazia callipaeda]|uniref:Protein kinase domain-containing protein n=1 Tax=Thelazia callipaeda TaxID=103827 RepID=A0A0N5CU71_THECL|nr:unnamed protein product [Thelazia callipaeda]
MQLDGKGQTTFSDSGVTQMSPVLALGPGLDRPVMIQFNDLKLFASGSFGIVYSGKLKETGEHIAIKSVHQNRRFKNRELKIMKKLSHKNVVKLKYYFYTAVGQKDEIFLNLVLEFMPATLYCVGKHFSKLQQAIPIIFVKLYMFQLFWALAYIHRIGICHRDIKPQNLLVNAETGVLKLCDFGSAKQLIRGKPNISYICSRYYRAPELIFGSINYTFSIDIWSAGTVLAELLLGRPIFLGNSSVDQLVEIAKILGTPSKKDIHEMNPEYKEYNFQTIKTNSLTRTFPTGTDEKAINLLSLLLVYSPERRLSALDTCAHLFFDDLRCPDTKLPNGRAIPSCIDFIRRKLYCDTDIAAVVTAAAIDYSIEVCFPNKKILEEALCYVLISFYFITCKKLMNPSNIP